MAITFPNSPSSGDTHTTSNGLQYTYDGEKWTTIGTNSAGTWTRTGTTVSLTTATDDLNVDSGTLFVDASTNRVGVGSSSPSAQLHVRDSANYNFTVAAGNSTTGMQVGNYDATDGYNPLTLRGSQFLFISTGGNERLRIDSSGRMGLGTSSPAGLLHIASTSGLASTVISTTAGSDAELEFRNTSGGNATWSAGLDFDNSKSFNLAYAAAEGASLSANSLLTVTTGGYAGIGTTLPTNKLHVSGDYIAVDNGYGLTTVGGLKYIADSDNNAPATGAIHNFYTDNGSTSALAILKNGNVGIGTTSPAHLLDLNKADNTTYTAGNFVNNAIARVHNPSTTTNSFASLAFRTASGDNAIGFQYTGTANQADFVICNDGGVNGNEVFRIDSSGRLLVGTSTGSHPLSVVSSQSSKIQFGQASDQGGFLFSDGAGSFGISGGGYYNGANWIAKHTASSHIRDDGDANIRFFTNSSLTAGSTFAPTERMRIDSGGAVFIGKSSDVFNNAGIRFPGYGGGEFTRTSGALLALNRLASDGQLVDFYRQGTSQGSISVSGTTVSYNGAHLARWSQLPGGVERTEILRGSVLSNLDEMCEWGEEDNEQLNRMKVSDVEGDKNVSGVFQAWDDDDDTYTNDFYCAMTGDFVIRIAQGTTVARGDLLMSAGDGTAKPQDDDIVRSKTIAKVTSTTVSETYADNSYCVPCVLMAC